MTCKILPKCPYACAACNMRLLHSEEDMAEGGRDSRGLKAFSTFKEIQICSLAVFWSLYECSVTAGQGWQSYLQELQEKSWCEGWQHIQFTQPSPSNVQRMQGKLILYVTFSLSNLLLSRAVTTHISKPKSRHSDPRTCLAVWEGRIATQLPVQIQPYEL